MHSLPWPLNRPGAPLVVREGRFCFFAYIRQLKSSSDFSPVVLIKPFCSRNITLAGCGCPKASRQSISEAEAVSLPPGAYAVVDLTLLSTTMGTWFASTNHRKSPPGCRGILTCLSGIARTDPFSPDSMYSPPDLLS